MSIEPNAGTWQEISKAYTLEPEPQDTDLAGEIAGIFDHAGIRPPASLLEAGCGSGHLSMLLRKAGYQTDLLDFSELAISKARACYRSAFGDAAPSNFISGDLMRLTETIAPGSYDVVWNSGVLEHFSRDALQAAIAQMKRAARKFVLFIVPNPQSLIYLSYRARLLEQGFWDVGVEFLRDDYADVLEAAGLQLADRGYCGRVYTRIQLEQIVPSESDRRSFEEVLSGGQATPQSLYLQYFLCARRPNTAGPKKSPARSNETAVIDRTFYLDAIGTANAAVARLRRELEEARQNAVREQAAAREQADSSVRLHAQIQALTDRLAEAAASTQSMHALCAEKELRSKILTESLEEKRKAADLLAGRLAKAKALLRESTQAAESSSAIAREAAGRLEEARQSLHQKEQAIEEISREAADRLEKARQSLHQKEQAVEELSRQLAERESRISALLARPPCAEQVFDDLRTSVMAAVETLEELKLRKGFRMARALQLLRHEFLRTTARGRADFLKRAARRAIGDRRPLSTFNVLDLPIQQLHQALGVINRTPGAITVDHALPPLPAMSPRPGVVNIVTYLFYDMEGKELMGGGAERYLIELCRLISELGYTPEIYQCGKGAWVRDCEGVKVTGIDVNLDIRLLNRKVHEQVAPGSLTIYSAFNVACPYHHQSCLGISHGIFWDHVGFQNPIEMGAIQHAIRNCRHLVSVDTNTINWVRATFKEYADRFTYIPNFVDLDVFRPAPPHVRDRLVVLYARRLYAPRGFWLVAEMVPDLLRKYPQVDIHFVGRGDERETQAVHELQAKHGDRVRWSFFDPDDMYKAYQDADISLVPTTASEGTSLSCLEAMACGNAVIATDVGGLPELVIDGYNGLLVAPRANELREAIERLINDPELRLRLQTHATQVAACYSIRVWRDRWRRILRQCLPGSDRSSRAEHRWQFLHLSAGGVVWDKMRQRPQQLFLALAEAGHFVHFACDDLREEGFEVDGRLHLMGRGQIPDVKRPVVYVYYTYHYKQLRELDNPIVLYDVLDDPCIHAESDRKGGVPRDADYLHYHNRLMREADVVITSSRRLLERYRKERPDMALVPNGVRAEDFRLPSLLRPADLPADGPVIGYYGAVAEWFDYELLERLASQRPDCRIVLMGATNRQAAIDAMLARHPNIRYLGIRPYSELPAYLAHFDVAIIPFVVNEITHSVSPVKFFEYMAGGKPVVSTGFEEIRQYPEALIGETHDDFIAKVDEAMKLGKDPAFLEQARRLVAENTWRNRAARILAVLNEHCGAESIQLLDAGRVSG